MIAPTVPAGRPTPQARTAPRCPRCAGNLFLERDIGRPTWMCLQCGRRFIAKSGPLVVPTPRAA